MDLIRKITAGLFLLVVGGLGALLLATIAEVAGYIPSYVAKYILAGMGITLGLALVFAAVAGLWILITGRDA